MIVKMTMMVMTDDHNDTDDDDDDECKDKVIMAKVITMTPAMMVMTSKMSVAIDVPLRSRSLDRDDRLPRHLTARRSQSPSTSHAGRLHCQNFLPK